MDESELEYDNVMEFEYTGADSRIRNKLVKLKEYADILFKNVNKP